MKFVFRFSAKEQEMISRAMAYVEAGEWPWTQQNDGTTPAAEARDRAAWNRIKEKLEL